MVFIYLSLPLIIEIVADIDFPLALLVARRLHVKRVTSIFNGGIMATINQWQDDLDSKTGEEISAIAKALDTLKQWKLFEKEYTEMRVIRNMVKQALLYKMSH